MKMLSSKNKKINSLIMVYARNLKVIFLIFYNFFLSIDKK